MSEETEDLTYQRLLAFRVDQALQYVMERNIRPGVPLYLHALGEPISGVKATIVVRDLKGTPLFRMLPGDYFDLEKVVHRLELGQMEVVMARRTLKDVSPVIGYEDFQEFITSGVYKGEQDLDKMVEELQKQVSES